jgi:alkanesulfonate monooxygenase SsuD/methylene tetrahydromethanopterin reductase-like flavin-dependent oxidoreductase (luciferase family)
VLVPQIFAPPWAALGAAAACDEDVELASGIAMAFVRSPLETAMAALDLDRLSGGRFTLGLGSSVRDWNVRRFGVEYDRPVSRLRELVGLVKRMVTVDDQPRIGRFRGSFWSVDLDGIRLPRPVRPTLPITVAPLRPAMTEMAAEVADGILGHPVWSPRWIAGEMHAAVERGLARADRQRTDIRITAWLRVAITDDVEQGRDDARLGIPFYASLRQYDSYFEALGLATDARRLQDLAESGAPAAEQSAAVSDAMADELVMIGPADEVAARIAEVLDVVDDVCITPPNGLPPERTRLYDEAIAAHLLPGRPAVTSQ